MIGTGNEAVPKRWKTDPEETRIVLSMTAHMEIGQLRALQAAVRRGPEPPGAAERISEIEQLLSDLQ
jgi:hypothetical protein